MKEPMRPITAHDADLVTDKFFSYLNADRDFVELLHLTIREYTVCLVGGSIRDIVNQTAPRDFDLIIDTDSENLRLRFSKYISKLNSFGGLKCVIDNYTVDIWSFNDNWAFKTGLIDKNVENIPRGAFYNIDALALDLSAKRIYYEFYNHCVNTRILDFVSHEPRYVNSNPVPAQNILKSYHVVCKYDLDLSEEVHNYIEKWKNSNEDYIHDIKLAEIKHYGHEVYNLHELELFITTNSMCIYQKRSSRKKKLRSGYLSYKSTSSKRKKS